MNENYRIIWKDIEIGLFENPIPDMWYLEGKWISNNNSLSQTFEQRASKFNSQEVYQDWTKGTWIMLKNEFSEEKPLYAVVFSLSEGNLFIRMITEKENIEWVISNVK